MSLKSLFLLIISILISFSLLNVFSYYYYIHLFYDKPILSFSSEDLFSNLNNFDLDNTYRNTPTCEKRNFSCNFDIFNNEDLNANNLTDYYNSLGVRDFEYKNDGSNCYNILMVGDSVIQGIGVKFNETIPYKMNTLLNNISCVRTYSVAVTGYNNYQELKLLEDVVKYVNPDMIVLNIVMNDIQHQSLVRNKGKKQVILFNSFKFSSFLNLDLLNKFPFFRLLNILFNNQEFMDKNSYFYNLNAESIIEISNLADSFNAQFLSIIYPHAESSIYGGMNNEYFKFEDILSNNNINFLNLFEYIYASKYNMFVDFSHFNPKGIEDLVSNQIIPFIEENSNLSTYLS